MSTFSSSVHMHEDTVVSSHAHSVEHEGGYETNWITVKFDRAEFTIFAPDLIDLVVIVKRMELALDEAIQVRADKTRPSVVDEIVGDDA